MATATTPPRPFEVVPLPKAKEKSRLAKFLELELLDNRYPALHGLRFLYELNADLPATVAAP